MNALLLYMHVNNDCGLITTHKLDLANNQQNFEFT